MSTWAGGIPGFHSHSQATTVALLSVPVPIPVPQGREQSCLHPPAVLQLPPHLQGAGEVLGCRGWVSGVGGIPRLTAPLVQGPLDTLPPYVRTEGQRRIHRYRGWWDPGAGDPFPICWPPRPCQSSVCPLQS